MEKYLNEANKRGYYDHGWLQTNHSFSFASYFDPTRLNFGVLRVLNEDRIQGGTGFDTHTHENMEIVTIPLKGALEHKDSTGAHGIIKPGEVQVMSAGTGISHSESNPLTNESTELLQLWILPDKQNIAPRYDQTTFNQDELSNFFLTVAAGHANEMEGPNKPLWINQDAYISLARIEGGIELDYSIYDINHGVFFFLINGYINIEDVNLNKRDSLEMFNFETDSIKIRAIEDSYLLVVEVPIE